ncbi:MAG: helix-turn-helix domain-containing protein [Lentisphaeria bacterium]|nr:helix-turn-helix domain-containing protein [Lentisphaeria bacterium]
MPVVKYDRPGRPSPYGVKWSDGGKRRFKFFKTSSMRNEYFRRLVKKENELGTALLSLSGDEAAIMRRRWKGGYMDSERILSALRAACLRTSQSEVARRVGITQSTVNDYLNGRSDIRNMTLETFERLMPVLGLRLSEARDPSHEDLAPLAANWHRLTPDSRAAIKTMADAILDSHGIKKEKPGGSSEKTA